MDFITAFTINRMLGSTRGEALAEGGRSVVTANMGLKLLAGLFPALPLGLIYAAVRYGDDGQPVLVYGVIGLFTLVAGALVYMVLLTRLEFDDHYIYFSSPLYRDRQIPWSSVTGGGYSARMNSYHVDTEEIGRIHVSPLQHGWVDFLRMAGGKIKESHGENPFESLSPEM